MKRDCLTDDDIETIKIHLNAFKEKLCNQRRWKEAEEYQQIIDRFMAFATAQPEYYDYSDIEPLWKSFAEENDINLTSTAKQLKDAMWVGYRKGKQDAQPQWIPCSKRLPKEEKESYWVCTDGGYQLECRWTNTNPLLTYLTTNWHWNIFDIPQYSKVVAWMPLPEPYKERREE